MFVCRDQTTRPLKLCLVTYVSTRMTVVSEEFKIKIVDLNYFLKRYCRGDSYSERNWPCCYLSFKYEQDHSRQHRYVYQLWTELTTNNDGDDEDGKKKKKKKKIEEEKDQDQDQEDQEKQDEDQEIKGREQQEPAWNIHV